VHEQLQKDTLLRCIFVDEAQFLTLEQVKSLTHIVDQLNLPVLAYGLRSDFQGNAFPGSLGLLLYADNLVELKTICHCGKKAIMNARINEHGQRITTGEQILIGGNEHYIALCRKHWNSEDY
jgi:thymidine kinase